MLRKAGRKKEGGAEKIRLSGVDVFLLFVVFFFFLISPWHVSTAPHERDIFLKVAAKLEMYLTIKLSLFLFSLGFAELNAGVT